MDGEASQPKMNAAEMIGAMESNPCGAVRSILGDELWNRFMDYQTPLPDGFARSAYTALNSIGVLVGAAGLQKWRAGRSVWGTGD